MEMDLVELWSHMNNLVRAVVIVLTIQAVSGIYVVIDRLILLLMSGARSRKFAAEAGRKLESGQYEDALTIAKKHEKSHLAQFIAIGVQTFLDRRRGGHSSHKAAEFTQRALERKGENLSDSLNRGLAILASTGSTAPFIGLLGTVLGILNAFRAIGEEASGGMGTIGPMIAEALIVTGYGLLVAIPSVLAFNWLSNRVAKYEHGLANAGSELVDQLEAGTTGGTSPDTEVEPASGEAVPSAA
ncbi:MAG TPA: MotA/TolQ/ExbB proton channel family protein [Sandaracinaceae bacterium LLY-WYZ-13_1]|nr:MotA/TolQ/ExbB proton channel family protein [Sandaracinaceae bacterium LLY-WYZ-13_1]